MEIDSCVILCGGKSSRMKSNKALLQFGEHSLLAFQYLKLATIFKKVYISCKASQKEELDSTLKAEIDNFNSDVFLLEDNEEIFAPINGILNIFNKLDDSKVFIISCDMPLIKQKTIKILLANAMDYDVVYAKDSNRIHPLVGVWSATMKNALESAMLNNEFKLLDLLIPYQSKGIYFDKIEFVNLNTKKDYKYALKLLQE